MSSELPAVVCYLACPIPRLVMEKRETNNVSGQHTPVLYIFMVKQEKRREEKRICKMLMSDVEGAEQRNNTVLFLFVSMCCVGVWRRW